jgi:hypothetical protein
MLCTSSLFITMIGAKPLEKSENLNGSLQIEEF